MDFCRLVHQQYMQIQNKLEELGIQYLVVILLQQVVQMFLLEMVVEELELVVILGELIPILGDRKLELGEAYKWQI